MILSSVVRVIWADLKLPKVRACIGFGEVCIKEQSHRYWSEQHFEVQSQGLFACGYSKPEILSFNCFINEAGLGNELFWEYLNFNKLIFNKKAPHTIAIQNSHYKRFPKEGPN